MKRFLKIFLLILFVVGITVLGVLLYEQNEQKKEVQKITTVACVGDSLTFRHGFGKQPEYNYPKVLGELLGENYEVTNYGESGTCVQENTSYPYQTTRVYRYSVEAEADIVIIMLGTNDVWDFNWKSQENFREEYVKLVDSYLQTDHTPEIYLCTIPKLYKDGVILNTGSGERVELYSNIIREFAVERGYSIIEMNEITAQHPEWYEWDGVHFTLEGAKGIAEFCYENIKL